MPKSYYDTDVLSVRFPLPRDFASYIERDRDANVHHINSRYGIMSRMPVRFVYGARGYGVRAAMSGIVRRANNQQRDFIQYCRFRGILNKVR